MQKIVYILTVLAHHDFDRKLHRSVHTTREGAVAHGDEKLKEFRAKEEPEWHYAIGYEVTDIEFHE
jgi:hypothetical protein